MTKMTYGKIVSALQEVRSVKNLKSEYKDLLLQVLESIPEMIEERCSEVLKIDDYDVKKLKSNANKKDAEIRVLNNLVDKLIDKIDSTNRY